MTSKPDADARLLDAHDLALAALAEITPASTVGPAAGYLAEDDGSVSLRFENRLAGYPGWYWTVTVARVEGEEPTVLEVELLPGDGALLAPEWVPWAERLAEYRAHQVELAEAAAAAGDDAVGEVALDADEDGVLEDDDLDDDDDDDDDDGEADILHAGDLDGVDIDELDEGAADDEESEDEESEDEESEDEESDDDADALDEDAGEVDEEE
ncbi:DUF3027 domain-containing protein [Microbacterium sp. STF-2]|uniref:DUF3027 domain-containing protein n=1 Tax=Microbacterium sp. STF-2 TaxID=3031132 RepID=UPI002AFDDD01|nr:DUF3027 domain-containing protein [Microbacterium sp. STF-2]MEA1262753.1 DUF3027 domain-containing protein [Microbacterium sp. STF-2]